MLLTQHDIRNDQVKILCRNASYSLAIIIYPFHFVSLSVQALHVGHPEMRFSADDKDTFVHIYTLPLGGYTLVY
jgi:hypothetical protein